MQISHQNWPGFGRRSLQVTLVWLAGAALAAVSAPDRSPPPGARADWVWRETALGPLPDRRSVAGEPLGDEHGWNYGLVVQRSTGRSLWLNGKFGPVFQDFEDVPIMDADLIWLYAFSPDGRRLAYTVREKGRKRMVPDGQPGLAKLGHVPKSKMPNPPVRATLP